MTSVAAPPPMKEAMAGLVCPGCRATVRPDGESLVCAGCGTAYPVVRGVPVMMAAHHQVMMEPPSRPGYVRWLKRMFPRVPHPAPKYSTATLRNFLQLRTMLTPGARLLVVGAGVDHGGNHIDKLGEALLANTVNLDVEPGSHTDVVADAHVLPFPDGHFDCVISQGVLEHTRNSDLVAAEMFRVLKPAGLVYAEVPFLVPGHMEHTDFRRFTLQGLETLFEKFTRVDSGVNGAGASALLWMFIMVSSAALSFGNDALYWFFKMFLTIVLLPIKYLDILLCKLPQARLMAAGNYYLGRKPHAAG